MMMNNAEYRAKIMQEMRKGGSTKKPKTVKQHEKVWNQSLDDPVAYYTGSRAPEALIRAPPGLETSRPLFRPGPPPSLGGEGGHGAGSSNGQRSSASKGQGKGKKGQGRKLRRRERQRQYEDARKREGRGQREE